MPGGGVVSISTENHTSNGVTVSAPAPGEYVRLLIADTGIGIPADILPRIFDPFFTTKTKGHGLDLATCYSIIKRHGGVIDVELEPGKGTTFHIYLPASRERAVDEAEKKPLHQGNRPAVRRCR